LLFAADYNLFDYARYLEDGLKEATLMTPSMYFHDTCYTQREERVRENHGRWPVIHSVSASLTGGGRDGDEPTYTTRGP
jgi:hypothetical protein